jgi:hypothetical protein
MKRLLAVLMLSLTFPLVAQNGPGGQEPWVYGPHNRWDSTWNQRPNPRRGACFFTTAPFQGNRFCVRSGDRLPSLPENFGDNISSIQTYGGVRVRIFNDRGFSGGSRTVGRSIPDLRELPFRGGHTWNNRISSLMVY